MEPQTILPLYKICDSQFSCCRHPSSRMLGGATSLLFSLLLMVSIKKSFCQDWSEYDENNDNPTAPKQTMNNLVEVLLKIFGKSVTQKCNDAQCLKEFSNQGTCVDFSGTVCLLFTNHLLHLKSG